MSDHLAGSSEPPTKRRKVRKGTRSCWECRRRKIKCQFDAPDDAACIGCKQRGTTCRSQEFDDENAPEPGQKPDPPLARRLDRLEQMMERIVDKIVPGDTAAALLPSSQHREASMAGRSDSMSSRGAPLAGRRESSVDVVEATAASEGPIAALLAMRHESVHRRGPSESSHLPTPVMTSVESSTPTLPATMVTPGTGSRPVTSAGVQLLPPLNQHFWVSNTFRSVIPPQSAVEAIVSATPGAPYVVAVCYTEAERRQGRIETASLAAMPPPTAHPLLLAKRALQILLCIQHLPPSFDWDALGTGAPMTETVQRLSNTSTLVTSNDELMGYAEGIECLILQGCYQVNSGSLRRAWVTIRRALGLAQMMGLDRHRSTAFRSCDPKVNPARRTTAKGLWFKVVYWDRYISLLLGLSVGSQDSKFGPSQVSELQGPVDRLEKAHIMISASISERNDNHRKDPARHHSIYALTQDIDLKLEAAWSAMPPGWWDEPRLDPFASKESLWEECSKIISQIHHFTLVLLLHVPYMLRELSSPRYDYSKTTCVTTARDLLSRFFSLRSHNVLAFSYRRADYAGLIAAMTLCLSYLGRRRTETWERSRLKEDSDLIGMTKRRMEHVARVNGDRLSKESVGIIEQLASIVEKAAAPVGGSTGSQVQGREITEDVYFHVPYLASIHLRMRGPSASSDVDWHGHRRHPSSATGALERMALSPSQQAAASLETSQSFTDVGFIQFVPYDHQDPFGAGAALGTEPDFMAGAEDWALQGVDTAFWSLFEGVM